jgi:hypothetical protein
LTDRLTDRRVSEQTDGCSHNRAGGDIDGPIIK